MKQTLQQLVLDALETLKQTHQLPADTVLPDFVIERTKSRQHGDFATNIAMALAKPARANPRQIATQLVDALAPSDLIDHVDIAGPGFINFFLTDKALFAAIKQVLDGASNYGRHSYGQHTKVNIEFVSANPTGPLHVGHGRAAVIGDCLSRLLDATGYAVHREFYYNDAGVQISKLAKSVAARARGITPDDPNWPQDGYRGDYIADVAHAFLDGASVKADDREIKANADVNDLDNIRAFAVAWLRHEQDRDLNAFHVQFDQFFLESSLYQQNKVEATVKRLREHGHTYEKDGALWLASTNFGDDKDRVMRKSDGSYTYFLPDVAYHMDKWQRGYTRAITELGADHHGSLTRVKAGLQALEVDIPENWPQYVLHQMVTVVRGGAEVKISKRAGGYVTLRDLINEVGCDATRYFLIARKADSQLTFDIDLARSASNDNPIYYIQYAHARIASVLRQAQQKGISIAPDTNIRVLNQLISPHEDALIVELAHYPEIVATSADNLEPHILAIWLREFAQLLHAYYNSEPFLVEDTSLRTARLTLLLATQQVLRNGLDLLGLSAPEHM